MAEILTILQDPEIVNLLQDKSVMQDVMSMNPTSIQNNSSIQALMQNPKMQNILDKLNQKMGNPGTSPVPLSPTAIP